LATLRVVRFAAFFAVAFLAGARRLATLRVVRFAAFFAGARFAVLRTVVRFAAFFAGARFAVFLARFTGMLYALLTAFLADRLAALLAGTRPAAFLADCCAAFLAGARFATLWAGARPTIFFAGRLADFLAGARVATCLADLWVAALPVLFAAFFVTDGFDPAGLSAGSAARPLTMSLSAPLAANRTPRAAAMRTGAPFCGLRPMRAPRCVGLKLPKPVTTTRRPARTSLATTRTTALTACSASRFASDVVTLTASISSDLFTQPPPRKAISLIKEGFRDKSKHLPRRRLHARVVIRKDARVELCKHGEGNPLSDTLSRAVTYHAA